MRLCVLKFVGYYDVLFYCLYIIYISHISTNDAQYADDQFCSLFE